MATMDVFKADAFSMASLLQAIEDIDHKPQFLGSLGLFDDEPQRTRAVMVETRANELALIQTTPIGAPLPQLSYDPRKVRNFNTFRIAKGSTIQAEQLQGIREFGSESELQQVQVEVARRMRRLVDDVELTWEHMRLGAVQGILADADDTTLVDYYSEFGVAAPAAVTFNFAALQAGEVRPLIEGVVRAIVRAAKGAFTTNSYVAALVGDEFWDALVNHAEIRQTYLNYQAAADLRNPTAFGQFRYGGVLWTNYRGTDDGSTVAVAADEAKFFPVNAPGIFKVAWGPGEFLPVVNQPGVPLRPLILPDPSGREAFVTLEVYSYPLYLCTKPLTLRSATLPT